MEPGRQCHLIHQIFEKLSKKGRLPDIHTEFGICKTQHHQGNRKDNFSKTVSNLFWLNWLIRGID